MKWNVDERRLGDVIRNETEPRNYAFNIPQYRSLESNLGESNTPCFAECHSSPPPPKMGTHLNCNRFETLSRIKNT